MPRHFEQKTVSYTSEQMFDLVADVERYPEFLPWCHAARILGREGNRITAGLSIGAGAFQETFTSHVALDRPGRISVTYGGGPLSHLSNEWRFVRVNGGGCEVTFYVDFAFRSRTLNAMMNLFFGKAFRKMASAFEARAKELYG